ncbi:transcriptional regulator [Mycobacterium tuberculosis]|nr:transcriptional regulator [Mycobacterium tuberculosis]
MSAGRPRIAGITLSARSAGFAGIRACRRTTAGTSLAARTAAAAGPALAAAAHGAVGARVATEPAARPARATGTAGTSGAAGATIATIAAVTAAATEGVTTPKGAGNAAATGPAGPSPTAHTAGTANAAGTASPAVTDQQPAGPASPRAAGTTHAARGSGIPVAAEATAATLGKAPSELVGEPTFPAVATEAAGSAGASDAAIATGAAGPAVTDQSRTVAGPTVLTGGTRPTVPAIAIQQSTRPTGLARPAVSAVADQRPANNAWVGALTALSTSCANVALAVSAAAYHPPPEVRAATNCARYAAACALICWYSCAFAPNSAAIAIDTSSAAVGRQRRRRACHERIGRADRRTDPRHICGGRGQKEGCAITNDM